MKVYVDEKDSGTTITFKEENGKRQYLYVHDKEGFIFKSIQDHDKQVRKEVVQEIRKMLPNYIYSFQEPEVPRTKVIELEDVKYILDQIQGETNVKD